MKDLIHAKKGTPVVITHGPYMGETGKISQVNLNSGNSTIVVKLDAGKRTMAAGWVQRMKIH